MPADEAVAIAHLILEEIDLLTGASLEEDTAYEVLHELRAGLNSRISDRVIKRLGIEDRRKGKTPFWWARRGDKW